MKVAIVLAVVTILLTVAGTLAGRGRTMTAAWVAPLYGGLVLVVIGAAAYVVQSSAQRDYERCVDGVERSAGSHKATIRLYDTLDFLTDPKYTHESFLPGEPSLRAGLDIDLPVLSKADCKKP